MPALLSPVRVPILAVAALNEDFLLLSRLGRPIAADLLERLRAALR
jgi:hypothetical protein